MSGIRSSVGSPARCTAGVQINGDSGNDDSHGTDNLVGGDGDDTIYGGADNDVIYGKAGNDDMHGRDGADSIYGGPGDDQLWAEMVPICFVAVQATISCTDAVEPIRRLEAATATKPTAVSVSTPVALR
jgi:hypothetical protein